MRAQALRLIDAGDSLNRISRATGINRATLREWRERRGTVAPRHECRCPPCSSTPLPRDPYLYLLGQYLGDGCISKLRRSWVLRIATCDSYPRIRAETVGAIGIFTDALDRLGVAWRRSNQWTISVARREAVAVLDAFVGPKSQTRPSTFRSGPRAHGRRPSGRPACGWR